jgi:tRNA (mo5U34)-methyltransferase
MMHSLAEQVARHRWYHKMELRPGLWTPGTMDGSKRLASVGMPDDLRGRTVLDIGAWDGFFSFEAERRGAEQVVALDSYAWDGSGWGTKDCFELAREALGSAVRDVQIGLNDLSAEAVGVFDVVLFLNVLYHLRHPLLALEKVYEVTGDLLILETHVDLLDCKRPAMAFYPEAELAGDRTNWWGPNTALVEAMLRDVGFSHVELYSQTPRASRVACALLRERSEQADMSTVAQQGRAVFHARK